MICAKFHIVEIRKANKLTNKVGVCDKNDTSKSFKRFLQLINLLANFSQPFNKKTNNTTRKLTIQYNINNFYIS